MNRARKKIFVLAVLVFATQAWPDGFRLCQCCAGQDAGAGAQIFVGQDLYFTGTELISYQLSEGEHSLVFPKGFSMSIGGNRYSSAEAMVWLKQRGSDFVGQDLIEVKATVYLRDGIKVERAASAKTAGLNETVLEKDKREIIELTTSGEVFVTADKRETSDNRQMEIYKEAFDAVKSLPRGPKFVVRKEALVPQLPAGKPQEAKPNNEEKPIVPSVEGKAVEEGIKPVESRIAETAAAKVKGVHFRYPVNLSRAGEAAPEIEKFALADGTEVATVIGRIYVWQKQDEGGRLLELQADNAVVFFQREKVKSTEEPNRQEDIFGGGVTVESIYMSGDVVLTEGPRTIRAQEVYYDFSNKKALVVNSILRTFDVERGIPIYIKAAKLRQLAANKFAAEGVVVTSSEFCKPQISLTVAEAEITDTTPVDEKEGKGSGGSFEAQMRDVRMKVGDTTVFGWPVMRSNAERPEMPFKGVHLGRDGRFGTSMETEWYLSRLLGLREPAGTKSTFNLDYYSKRGVGSGAEIEYEREKYFGRAIGYIIDDHGEDRLGELDSRRNLEPPEKLRGRFQVQNRNFLPYNWQVTTEIGYVSDEHFLESYYRGEFDVGKEQETLVHLKRLEDNWAISILGKARINNFADELEELPSFEYHRTGESLFGDTFTLYSDTGVSRLRQQIGDNHSVTVNSEEFTFVSHRTELDMPLRFDTLKAVPYVAGTYGHDDRSGFSRGLVDGSNSGSFGEEDIWIGEGGVRVSDEFWKLYPGVRSRIWDVNGLRHIVQPQVTGVVFDESSSVAQQHNMLSVDILQRFQTKRGPADQQRTIDWMRLDTAVTFVKDEERANDTPPDRFIWNQPMTPLRVLSAPQIFNDDIQSGLGLERAERFGPEHSYFGADYVWRISDTFALLSDSYYDMHEGVLKQYNIGISRLVWPNLSYYIGSRYLRRINVLDEKSSNAFVFAATYEIDPRYTLVIAQQYDFGFGTNMRSDVSLIRRYHRLFYGLTYSADRSLDRQAIVFSIWPQGVPELALGPRRYTR